MSDQIDLSMCQSRLTAKQHRFALFCRKKFLIYIRESPTSYLGESRA